MYININQQKKRANYNVICYRYATDMDKFMKMMMLMDFAICSMQIAVIAFQVIVVSTAPAHLQLVKKKNKQTIKC